MSDSGFSGVLPTLPSAPAETPKAAFDSLKGTERLETGELIGKGGMGQVFSCTDLKLKRAMAMKQATSRAPLDLERFVREARVQGQLQHPSIVPVHELGLGPDGLPFFTMKRVRGVTLADVILALAKGDAEAKQKHSRRRLLTAFQSVCQAVEFAHSQGVLHRDLKPANVMLGDFGEVYVLDWGLAKPQLQEGQSQEDLSGAVPAQQGQADEAQRKMRRGEATREMIADVPLLLSGEVVGSTPTVAGSLLGTPGYMSPELVVGKPASVQSDVFALGSLLFELLTHERMVPGQTVMEILTATRDGFDARVRTRAPDAEVAPELEVVVLEACAAEPAQRYPSVRALHDAVERILSGERDLELRSEMAKEHAARAAAEVAQMRKEGAASDDTRRRALQEVGRSLALEPKNGAAFAALLELLQTPPKEKPREVAETLRRSGEAATRTASLMASIGFALLLMYLPWMYQMGVRDWPKLGSLGALMAVASGASYLVYRMTRPRPEITTFSVMTFMLIGGVLNTVVMPFIVAPPLVTVAVLAYMLLLPHGLRVLTLVMATLALLAPLIAWWVGLSGPPLSFVDGSLIITPRLVTFDPTWTIALIIDSTVVTVALGAWSAVRLRNTLERAQEQIAVQAWNLRQLLPPEAGDATLLNNTAADPQCALEGFFTAKGLRQHLQNT